MSWHPNLTRPCEQGCRCGKHNRTPEHNVRIGISVALTNEAKRTRGDFLRTDCGLGADNQSEKLEESNESST